MYNLLNKCVQIERTTARIYHEFARNKKCDPVLAEIWLTMAEDEEDHVQQLMLAIRLLNKNIGKKNNNLSDTIDELLALAKGILEKARNEDYDIAEMLKDAILMESSFLDIHATHAIAFNDPSLLATFKQLARADELHVKGLKDYLMDYQKQGKHGLDCAEELSYGTAS